MALIWSRSESKVWALSYQAREVEKWLVEFKSLPPLSVGLGKRVVDKSLDADIHSSLDLTAQVQSMLLQTEDFVEGVRAKMEKREHALRFYLF